MLYLPDAIFFYDKDCFVYKPLRLQATQNSMKRNHSFTFVTFVNDVIFTSGKNISNTSFQVSAVLLTLLSLINF